MNVQKSTVAEIGAAANFAELIAEYASETAVAGMPTPAAKMELYGQLEALGMLHVFGAKEDGGLIGFITVLAPVLPHYSATVAVSESFFVAKAYRHTLAGLALLHAAEAKAAALGSPVLLVSAPYEGKLFHVLPRVGYVETNRVFCKKVADTGTIPATSKRALVMVRALEQEAQKKPQVPISTTHVMHAGVYSRTILIPAGVLITGVQVKVATQLIVHGDVDVYVNDTLVELRGYNVLRASAGRKQAFRAWTDTYLTMFFASDVQTAAEAEKQFTDETHLLASRRDVEHNHVVVTGDNKCLE